MGGVVWVCIVHPHTGQKACKAHADDGTVRERHKDSDAVAGSILYIYIYIYIYICIYTCIYIYMCVFDPGPVGFDPRMYGNIADDQSKT